MPINPDAGDLAPVIDKAIQDNFRKLSESNRRVRRLLNLLFRVLDEGGFAVPADLLDQFNEALEATG